MNHWPSKDTPSSMMSLGVLMLPCTFAGASRCTFWEAVTLPTILPLEMIVPTVTASQKVHLLAPANVQGNIKTPKLIIEEGVSFDGQCFMANEKKAADQKVVSLTDRT